MASGAAGAMAAAANRRLANCIFYTICSLFHTSYDQSGVRQRRRVGLMLNVRMRETERPLDTSGGQLDIYLGLLYNVNDTPIRGPLLVSPGHLNNKIICVPLKLLLNSAVGI